MKKYNQTFIETINKDFVLLCLACGAYTVIHNDEDEKLQPCYSCKNKNFEKRELKEE